MATPFVPVPVPMGNSSAGSITTRSQRSSSLGSNSTSSNSSKEPHEDLRGRKKLSAPDHLSCTSSVCSSPLVRTKFDSSVEYSSRPVEHEHIPNSGDLEERPSTPTILGYEVMEERAKFTVSFIHLQCYVYRLQKPSVGCSLPKVEKTHIQTHTFYNTSEVTHPLSLSSSSPESYSSKSVLTSSDGSGLSQCLQPIW